MSSIMSMSPVSPNMSPSSIQMQPTVMEPPVPVVIRLRPVTTPLKANTR